MIKKKNDTIKSLAIHDKDVGSTEIQIGLLTDKISKLAVPINSKGRFYKEKKTSLRNEFQRDRDRIIHSTAFRRLKHKTQVFVNTSGDHFRTRITHSLEVSQIARTLSKFFNLNEDLSETLSLAHDLGHTPFGHAGEEALNYCMNKFKN